MLRFVCLLLILLTTHACSSPTPHSQISAITQHRWQQKAEKNLRAGQPFTAELDRNGIKLAGEYRLLRGGSLQWFRLPEATWDDRMKKYREMGFNVLDIYIAWNQVEPREGEFNFDQPNLRRFLELARENGIFVAIRPGPFITNEMDGGGLPAWLSLRSTKASFNADGQVNIRSHDPDFIAAVRRYWNALNEVIKPYTADQGGPVVLYVVENEYTWFEQFFGYEKYLFSVDGRPERPWRQPLPTKPYFQALHDIVRQSGITLPIVSCPGDGKVSAMGDVPGVAPFPNIYEWANPGQPEEIVFDLLTDMHDPEKHGGIYQNMPTGSMEVNRSTQEVRRLIMGGADATFAFNVVGMIQPGRMNAVTLAARAADQPPHWGAPNEEPQDWVGTIFDFGRFDRIVNGFAAPKMGYFGGVVDYNSAISSSGVLRDLYYQFRRDNFYWDAIEPYFAGSEKPQRSGTFKGANPDLVIQHPHIGVRQEGGMYHYWHEGAEGTAFVSLLNQSGAEQTLPLGSIRFKSEVLPRYEPILVPLAQEARSFYAQIMNFNVPLSADFKLAYSTSEVLTFRPWNQDRLLIVYGPTQAFGEMKIKGRGLKLVYADPGVQLRESSYEDALLTYPHVHGSQAILENEEGQRLRIVSTDTTRAGSFWFLEQDGHDLVMAGPDYVEAEGGSFRLDFDEASDEIWTLSQEPWRDASTLEPWQAFDPLSGVSRWKRPALRPWPALPELQNLRVQSDRKETAPDYDTSTWLRWDGEPRSLESLGVYQGHVWYRSTFEVPDVKKLKNGRLYVQNASDIIGIYINDQYITTVAPVGTEIDNQSWTQDYRFTDVRPFLKNGRNVITFRTEIWGHGSFMWGRGNVSFLKAQLPALPYDGLKGLMGPAHIAGIPLTQWELRQGLSGEAAGYARPDYNDENWTATRKPLQLTKGDILWLRSEFNTDAVPSRKDFDAPMVLRLEGLSSKATIYLNGFLLGRWLSDAGWLQQGSWIRPQVGMWVSLDPNDLPLPYELLNPEGSNQLTIAFEDSSGDRSPVGVITTMELRYNNEDQRLTPEGRVLAPGLRQRILVKP